MRLRRHRRNFLGVAILLLLHGTQPAAGGRAEALSAALHVTVANQGVASGAGGGAEVLSAALQGPALLPESSGRLRGFEVGVARRYALGPPDALIDGEAATWSITLHHIEGEGVEQRGVFDLEYQRREPFGPLREPRVTRSVWAELTVNSGGFPLRLIEGERIEDGEIITEIHYLGAGRFAKTIRWPESELTTDLRLPREVDDDAPAGLFLFLTRIADRRFAGGAPFMDSPYANPGLLTLALPSPLPVDTWKRSLYFLTPGTRLQRYADQRYIRIQRDAWVLRSHFDNNTIELRETEEIQLGERVALARRFEIEGPFRSGYLDASGRVLMLEYDAGAGLPKRRHIRLLHPGEGVAHR